METGILSEPKDIIALVAAIIAAIGVAVAIITFAITNHTTNKREFINTFDKIYKRTFSLRKDILNNPEIKDIGEFHYELDTILRNKNIEMIVLDYLTEIENLSVIICKKNNFFYLNLFKKLASVELYKRLLCLYPYIIHQQKATNNKQLFSNYVALISKIEKSKINISNNSKKRIYSGIRASDIIYDSNYFSESLCIFGDTIEKSFSSYRANQNYNKRDFTDYYANNFSQLNNKYSNKKYEIILYNQQNMYELSPEIKKHVICCNKEPILLLLNDKIAMKQFLENHNIDVPNYVVINGYDLKNDKIIDVINCSDFIVQNIHGGGGIGTYLFNEKSFENNKYVFDSNGRYIVSKYIKNSVSVNVHIFVSDNVNLVTPGSIQIIETIDNQLMYRGADFISYRDIPIEQRENIRQISLKISNILRNEGYRGVAGLDFIIDNEGKIYCSEINPRFQASSVVLSKYLYENATKDVIQNTNSKMKYCFEFLKHKINHRVVEDTSIYEINNNSFRGIVKNGISYYDEINYSCYFYYNDANLSKEDIDIKLSTIEKIKRTQQPNDGKIHIADISYDSYKYFKKDAFNEKSYLFRVIYENKISQISCDHNLWINDNIKISQIPDDNIKLKIALVNQGVRINNTISLKKAVFSGVDFYIEQNGFYVNSPVNIGFANLSPFEIKQKNSDYFLYYYSKKISRIIIEMDYLNEEDIKINDDLNLKDILYISTDRIRIKPINGCDYKSCGTGCRFCELLYSKKHYSLDDIRTAIKISEKLKYNHILVGGGSDISESAWDNIISIVKEIKKTIPEKPISLMSIPAPTNYLNKLYDAGVQEVAFNLEVFDDELAAYYMPGKRNYNYDYYYNSLKTSVEIFGKYNVRSAFVVGLESSSSLLTGIEELCKIGVIPCLSVYRMVTNNLSNINPTNEYLEGIYYRATNIVQRYNMFLGPKCEACKNNMLSI